MEICRVRQALESDVAFILANWVNSYCKHHIKAQSYTACHSKAFYPAVHAVAQKLLTERQVMIACSAENPDDNIGFIVGIDSPSATIVDYVYVKHDLRRLGVARLLLLRLGVRSEKPLFYTHETRKVKHLIKDHKAMCSYIPPQSAMSITTEGVQEAYAQAS